MNAYHICYIKCGTCCDVYLKMEYLLLKVLVLLFYAFIHSHFLNVYGTNDDLCPIFPSIYTSSFLNPFLIFVALLSFPITSEPFFIGYSFLSCLHSLFHPSSSHLYIRTFNTRTHSQIKKWSANVSQTIV